LIQKALKRLLAELTATNGDLRPLISKYRMGGDIENELNIALSYLSKNSQNVGHDLFKLNNKKELNNLLNMSSFELKPFLTQENKSSCSVFFVEDVHNRDIDSITILNSKKNYKLNKFFIENMTAIGGGNLKKLKEAMNFIRCGGSKVDKIRYLTSYNTNDSDTRELARNGMFKLDYKMLAKKIYPGELKKIKIQSLCEVMKTIEVNLDANPGYVLNNLGFQKKSECVPLMIGAYEMIYNNWTSQECGFQPKINWTMASRPKIINWEKAVNKARHDEPIGRVISLPDGIEQWINHPVWYPVMSRIKFYNKECLFGNTPIMLGVRRAGLSWNYLRYHMKKRKYIYSGDWSQYDQRVNSYLFENALQAISYLFDHEDVSTHNYIQNWIKFVREQVMNGTYIIDNSQVL